MNPRRSPLPTDVGSLPDLPPAFDEVVSVGLDALRLELDDAARGRIRDHIRLLLAWNEAINLTAIRDPVAAATAHILDSLSAAPLLRSERVASFVDVGSGGGFPGIPLAVALPAEHAVLVESIAKKARFLETAIAALRLGGVVEVRRQRAEEVAPGGEGRTWPAVVARAVAALPRLVELAMPLLDGGGVLIAWKRLPLEDELEAARSALATLGGSAPEVHPVSIDGLDDHVLVVIRKVADAKATRGWN